MLQNSTKPNKLRDLIPTLKTLHPKKNSCFYQDPSKISCWSHFQTTIETPKAMPFLKPKKTVVITGASSGLGLAAAKSLAEQGWQVPWSEESGAKEKNPAHHSKNAWNVVKIWDSTIHYGFGMCLKVMIIRILSTMRFIAIRSSQENICVFWFTYFPSNTYPRRHSKKWQECLHQLLAKIWQIFTWIVGWFLFRSKWKWLHFSLRNSSFLWC